MTNPYAPPTVNMSSANAPRETYLPSPLRLRGRIGRVRWLGYSTAYVAAGVVLCALVSALAAPHFPALVPWITAAATFNLFGVFMITGTRRLNDMNHSAWWTLITIVPIINTLFWLWLVLGNGTEGPNEYGPAPGPNSRTVIAAAWLGPGLVLVGIVAAVGIPAYQDYTAKAKQAAVNPSS